MHVITVIVGSAIARRRVISPGTFMPNSITATSAVSGNASSVSGTPTRLFRLPAVACTSSRLARTERVSSFVVVLPLEPAIATTGPRAAHARRR